MLNDIYLGVKFALSYFSIIPIHFKETDNLSTKRVLAFMLLSLPFVGVLLGTITVTIYSLLEHLGWYGALISALIYMMLYGFIHTEAVIDVADAIYASHGGKDSYEIIKEPTVGAMGVLYAVATMLLKISGVIYLLMHGFLMEFIAIIVLSRISLLLLFYLHTFRSSFATQLKESLGKIHLISASILIVVMTLTLTYHTLWLLPLALLFASLISWSIKKRIGFVNGDVLGATLEGVETLLFFVVALWL